MPEILEQSLTSASKHAHRPIRSYLWTELDALAPVQLITSFIIRQDSVLPHALVYSSRKVDSKFATILASIQRSTRLTTRKHQKTNASVIARRPRASKRPQDLTALPLVLSILSLTCIASKAAQLQVNTWRRQLMDREFVLQLVQPNSRITFALMIAALPQV